MPSPVDTLKAMRDVADQLGLHSEERAAIDAAIAALDGGEAVAFCRHYPEGGRSGWYDAKIESDLLAALRKSGQCIEFAYTAPRTVPDGEPLRLAFVDGAKWWEWHKTGATMWQSDQALAYEEAAKKYAMLAAAQQGEAGPGAG